MSHVAMLETYTHWPLPKVQQHYARKPANLIKCSNKGPFHQPISPLNTSQLKLPPLCPFSIPFFSPLILITMFTASDLKRGFGRGCGFGRGVAVMREIACRGTDRGRRGVKGLT